MNKNTTVDYLEKLKDPRWQKKRLEIFQRDNWACNNCYDSESTLHVHHRRYLPDKEPWDYPNELFITLCESCHKKESETRKDIEGDLLEILKINFLSDDIHKLATGFLLMRTPYPNELIAEAIGWAISNPDMQEIIVRKYLDTLCCKVGQNAK